MSNRIGSFTTTVTTSGTQVQLSTTVGKVNTVIVQAKRTNTGYTAVGDSTADYATMLGIQLGEPALGATPASVTFSSSREGANEVDLADIWVDAEVNGEGVSVTYTKA